MVVASLLSLSSIAVAEREGPALRRWRPSQVTVGVGAALPLFQLYEVPGPLLAVTGGWRLGEQLQIVASIDAAMLIADGARRYVGSVGAALRVTPWNGPVWLQLGAGFTGHVERIGVVLPERMVENTDAGAIVTSDIAIGVRVRGWELHIAYDRVLVPWTFYEIYNGVESLPFDGTGKVWIGRQL